ncbi:MAG TPA: prephenate dehydrogenase/arogenate dehydrogenase family protein [Anaerolineales bacterium]|nr:prephenate dehydrogenase/arogenate dehydrogenase family protein [Anaerolineales bacterium]
MPETVTILIAGTGQIGTIIGLALRKAAETFQRIGFDPDPKVSQQARKLGAIDREAGDLARPAAEADLVILTLTAERALEAAEALAGRLRPDTVVLSTGRLQGPTLDAIRSRLSPHSPVLGTVPFLGPRRALGLIPPETEPSPDFFQGGMLGIILPPGTPEGAVEIALDLAAILGTEPFFLDAAEADSLTATSDELPTAVAAALIASLTHNPGWRDQRRLVGRSLARLAALVEDEPTAESAREMVANRANLLARLDALSDEMAALRSIVEAGDEARLAAQLDAALEVYRDWKTVRMESRPDHGVELPGMPRIGLFDRLFGRSRRPPDSSKR